MTPMLDIRRPSRFVAEVWLDRPDVRNAFNEGVIAELHAAFTAFAADVDLRVIVLGGRGKAFCAGADLSWMRAMAGFDWEENRADAQALADMLFAIWRCPVPVVGRVHGDCYAGGVGLAAVCDVLVAAEGVNFCLSEAKLGLLPGTISPYVIRAMGEQAARRYFVTAERFSAAQAHAMGFVHELCAADALDAKVDEIVATLVANGPMAVRACKR
ncbi:MAG: enoyl-CoA hydratase/isomerase family protein, partial [Rhizobiales bacterium]|nr:enoyl-CoA hydratase/isomerase family protein [Rhizobacter sp.]